MCASVNFVCVCAMNRDVRLLSMKFESRKNWENVNLTLLESHFFDCFP